MSDPGFESQRGRATSGQALVALVGGVVFMASVVGAFNQSRADSQLQAAAATTTTTAVVVVTTTAAPPPPSTAEAPASTSPPTTAAAPNGRREVPGFGNVQYTVRTAAGEQNKCALLAETLQQQATGLMNQPDMAGHDAMVFRFNEDMLSQFYMANVRFPLTIAFYAADGTFVDSKDMPICTTEAGECPTYGPGRPYRLAFEMPQGQLEAAGLGPGTTVSLGGPCA